MLRALKKGWSHGAFRVDCCHRVTARAASCAQRLNSFRSAPDECRQHVAHARLLPTLASGAFSVDRFVSGTNCIASWTRAPVSIPTPVAFRKQLSDRINNGVLSIIIEPSVSSATQRHRPDLPPQSYIVQPHSSRTGRQRSATTDEDASFRHCGH